MARSLKGKLKPKKWREERSKATLAEKNPNWKGDEVGKYALHLWVKARLPRTKMCEFCGLVPPKDLANISQKYLRKLTDWEWLCRKCHMKKDGRYKNLKQFKV